MICLKLSQPDREPQLPTLLRSFKASGKDDQQSYFQICDCLSDSSLLLYDKVQASYPITQALLYVGPPVDLSLCLLSLTSGFGAILIPDRKQILHDGIKHRLRILLGSNTRSETHQTRFKATQPHKSHHPVTFPRCPLLQRLPCKTSMASSSW